MLCLSKLQSIASLDQQRGNTNKHHQRLWLLSGVARYKHVDVHPLGEGQGVQALLQTLTHSVRRLAACVNIDWEEIKVSGQMLV